MVDAARRHAGSGGPPAAGPAEPDAARPADAADDPEPAEAPEPVDDSEPVDDPEPVEVRRSRRRRRTVTAYRQSGRTIVLIPARFTRAQEREWVDRMVERLSAQERRRRPADDELMDRALDLSRRYLRGRAEPASVVWSAHQHHRWGSCTPADATIRLSDRLQGMPAWVIDYVILHELAHLVVDGHGREFWALLEGYPRTERARGYLDGFAAAQELGPPDRAPEDTEGDVPGDVLDAAEAHATESEAG